MGISVEGQVGPRYMGDGGNGELRVARDAAVVAGPSHGAHYEAVYRGQVFSMTTAQAGITVAAGNVAPMSAGGTPHLALYNPYGSGIYASVICTVHNSISGTPGVGAFSYCVGANNVITAAGNVTARCNLISGRNPICRGYSATAMTGSLLTQIARPIGMPTFAGAVAATTFDIAWKSYCYGEFVLGPGGLFVVCIAAAGSTHVVASSITWEEIPGASL